MKETLTAKESGDYKVNIDLSDTEGLELRICKKDRWYSFPVTPDLLMVISEAINEYFRTSH